MSSNRDYVRYRSWSRTVGTHRRSPVALVKEESNRIASPRIRTPWKTAALSSLLISMVAIGGCSGENAAYSTAATRNTTDSYTTFLQRYPNGARSDEARENLDWLRVTQAKSLLGYASFLKAHPQSARTDYARKSAQELMPTALHHLMATIHTWSVGEKDMLAAVLSLSPDNPHALFLQGANQFLMGQYGQAGDSMAKAKAHAGTSTVSDLAMFCAATGPASPFLVKVLVVAPPLEGPESEDTRRAIRDARSVAWAVTEGQCLGALLFSPENERQDSPRRLLLTYIDGYLDLLAK